MPIIAGAKKALKQNKKNKARNDFFRELYREKRVAFEKAIKDNNLKLAKEIYASQKKDGKTVKSGLQSMVDKLIKKHIIHKNNGARRKAKFVKMIKTIEKEAK